MQETFKEKQQKELIYVYRGPLRLILSRCSLIRLFSPVSFFFSFLLASRQIFFTRNKRSENINSTDIKCTCISDCKCFTNISRQYCLAICKIRILSPCSCVFHNHVTGLYHLPSFIIAILEETRPFSSHIALAKRIS